MPSVGKFLVAVVVLFSVQPVSGQLRTISGTVTDSQGFPIPGVSVVVSGTNKGTQTDFDGTYSLEANNDEILVVSHIGFRTQSIPIGGQTVIDVILREEATLLDEVVLNVLALGTRKTEDLTSSTNIDAKAVERSAETGLIQGMAGKTSGVTITRNNGDPGTGGYIQIRGQNTILGDASPLIILDGIPISNASYSGFAGGPSASSRLNDIDESDIASITVLKGASAAALYGTGAANGVLVIRTKSGAGSAGDLNIDVQLRLGFDMVNREFPKQETFGQGDFGAWNANDVLQWGDKISERPGGPDDILIGNERFEARDGSLYYPILNKNSRETFNGSNRDQVFQTGVTFDRSVALTYSGDHSNTYMSYNDWEQEGVLKGNSDYRRQNLRFKHTQIIRDAWEITFGATYSRVKRRATVQGSDFRGLYVSYLRTPPDFDNRDYIGTYYDPDGVPSPDAHRAYRSYLGAFPPGFNNPGWTLYEQSYNEGTDRFIANPQIRWNISDNLSLTGRYGIDFYANNEQFFFPVNTAGALQTGGLVEWMDQSRIEDYNFFLNGRQKWTSFLEADWVVGINFNSFYFKNIRAGEFQFLNPFVGDLRTLGNAEAQNNFGEKFERKTKKSGVYGLFNLSAWEALRLEASFRYERPSSLEKNIFYPSASLGWTLTESLGPLGFLNFAKVRLSYGEIGIEPPPYASNTVYGPGGTLGLDGGLYGGAFARYPQRGNPDLKEERIREFEIGSDLGLFENRLSLNITYYNRVTRDAILSQPLPPSSGFTSELRNAAEISNRGIEIDARYNLFDLPDFQWSVSGNFSLNRNIVEKLPGVNSVVLDGNGPISARAVEGEPFSVLWGPRPLTDESGMVFDSFGYPLLDPETGIIGDPNPDWRGGLSTRISWKGITFTALLETFQGADMSGGTYNFLQLFGVPPETAAESVAPAGGFTNIQGVQYPEGTVFRGSIRDFGAGPVPLDIDWYTSQRILVETTQDGSWTRIRELSLFYGFPERFCRRIGLRKAEIGVTGRNLFLWTDFIGNDPDLNLFGASKGRGIDFFTNPGTKGYMFTLNLGL